MGTLAATAPQAELAATRPEAAAWPGQWWNAACAERLNITLAPGAATLTTTDCSTYVTIDPVCMVSTGRNLPSGDDVPVAYWNGGGWVELDRPLDERNEAAIWALATEDDSCSDYGTAAGAPLASRTTVLLFGDDFNDAGPDTTARWTSTETRSQPGRNLSLPAASSIWGRLSSIFGCDVWRTASGDLRMRIGGSQ